MQQHQHQVYAELMLDTGRKKDNNKKYNNEGPPGAPYGALRCRRGDRGAPMQRGPRVAVMKAV